MSRGNYMQNNTPLEKYYLEVKGDSGERVKYSFDRKKHKSATVKTEISNITKVKQGKLNIKQKYTDAPVVVVFKSSNRSNAKTKIKVFNNKNIDDIISNPQPGIPDKAEILEIGVGKRFIDKYTKQYHLKQYQINF